MSTVRTAATERLTKIVPKLGFEHVCYWRISWARSQDEDGDAHRDAPLIKPVGDLL